MTSIAISFDTLKFVERLKAAGVPEAHAKAEAEALVEVFAASDLATPAALRELELRLDAKIDKMSAELRIELQAAKADIVKWLAGLLLAQAGLVAALVKLL